MSQLKPKETEVAIRIVLIAPPAGVDFGVQDGKGNNYTMIQKQRSTGADLEFECMVTAKDNRADGSPNFLGSLAQGPSTGRFIYISSGKSAGQTESCWVRRLKISLAEITWEMIVKSSADPQLILEVRLPGTGKDGGPSCATVRPSQDWHCCRRQP